MPDFFELTAEHRRWAGAAQPRCRLPKRFLLELIRRQRGLCAWSGAPLRFDSVSGTSQKGGHGPHPLYAVLDRSLLRRKETDPGQQQLVSLDLDAIAGGLPLKIIQQLQQTPSWTQLMKAWRRQALTDGDDRDAFARLLG